jgi:hypothetical protein
MSAISVSAAATAAAAPTLTAALDGSHSQDVEFGNFTIQGSGFTPGNGLVSVWLIDFTTNQILWFTPAAFAFPNGMIGVTGPMDYSPPSGISLEPPWTPHVQIPCGHNVRAIAKDGEYFHTNAAWSNVSQVISPACAP